MGHKVTVTKRKGKKMSQEAAVNFLTTHGVSAEALAGLSIDQLAQIWALIERYGPPVAKAVESILPLLKSGLSWSTAQQILQIILAAITGQGAAPKAAAAAPGCCDHACCCKATFESALETARLAGEHFAQCCCEGGYG